MPQQEPEHAIAYVDSHVHLDRYADDAITAMVMDPERCRRMGEAGRKRVYPAYTADRLVRDVESLYEELLSRTA